jgi:hypothetical protein
LICRRQRIHPVEKQKQTKTIMRRSKLIVSLAAAVCAFAVCNAHAQTTNIVTFSATETSQGTISTTQGTNTSFALAKASGVSTADVIEELGLATTNNFSKAAKLVIISGNDAPTFAVIDGANFVDVSAIMNLSFPSENNVQSGIENGGPKGSGGTGLAFKTLKQLQILELDFNDIDIGQGHDIQFSLRGLATATTTDTVPSSAGVYTETFSAKITSMTGDGTKDGVPFVATGSLSASGKGVLTLPPPPS